MEGDSVQDVVMERDGRFEVLSAVDLQAEQESQQPQQLLVDPTVEAPAGAAVTNENVDKTSPTNEDSESGETKSTVLEKEGDGLSFPTTSTEPCSPQNLELKTEPQVDDTQPSVGDELGEHALTEVSIEQSQPTQSGMVLGVSGTATAREEGLATSGVSETCKQLTTGSDLEDRGSIDTSLEPLHPVLEKSLPQHKGEVKVQQQIRTQSAPGSRSTKGFRQRKEEEEAEEQENRKRMSEAAFSAWILRKNEEVMARRKQERAKLSSKVEDEQQKKEMCDLAYKNWLEAKNKQYQSQRAREALSRPSTSVPKRDEEYCRQAFENWMTKKRTQYLEEIKKQRMKSREMQEAAERADPSVIDKAYKE